MKERNDPTLVLLWDTPGPILVIVALKTQLMINPWLREGESWRTGGENCLCKEISRHCVCVGVGGCAGAGVGVGRITEVGSRIK